MRRTLILATLALAASSAFAQAKPLPWQYDPNNTVNMPWKKIETADGCAALWTYKVGGVQYHYEVHAVKELCSFYNVVKVSGEYLIDPQGTFWSRARTSSCFDPRGYWPTQQERNLCVTVRAEWAAWIAAGLK